MGEDTRFILECLFGFISAAGALLYWMLRMILHEAINEAVNQLHRDIQERYVSRLVFEQLEARLANLERA
jgi:hypothetical protein